MSVLGISKRVLLTLAFLLAFTSSVFAAPTVVNTNSAGQNNANATISVSMTISGTNRLLVCGTSVQFTNRTVVSAVFNTNESLTQLTSKDFEDGGSSTQSRAELWYLVAPTVTTANVDFTFSTATAMSVGCIALSGVDQATSFGTPATAGARTNTSTVDAASATGELVIDVSSIRVGTTGITEGAGQTNRVEQLSGSGVGNVTLGMSTEAGATTTTMSWTMDDAAAKTWAAIAVGIKPAASAGTTKSTLLLLGIG